MAIFSDFIQPDKINEIEQDKLNPIVSSQDFIVNKIPLISYGTDWTFINNDIENLLRLSSISAKSSVFTTTFGSQLQSLSSLANSIFMGIKMQGMKNYVINTVNSTASNIVNTEFTNGLKYLGKLASNQIPSDTNIGNVKIPNMINRSISNTNINIGAIKDYITNTKFLYHVAPKFDNFWLIQIPKFPETWTNILYRTRPAYKNVNKRATNLGYTLEEIIANKDLFTYLARSIVDYVLMDFETNPLEYPNKSISFINKDKMSNRNITINFALKKNIETHTPTIDDILYLLRESAFDEEKGIVYYPIDYMLPEVKLYFLVVKPMYTQQTQIQQEAQGNTSNNTLGTLLSNTLGTYIERAKQDLTSMTMDYSSQLRNVIVANESSNYHFHSIEVEKVVTYRNCFFTSTPPTTLEYKDDPEMLKLTATMSFQDMEIEGYGNNIIG